MVKEKIVDLIGWCAAVMCVLMFIAYFDQIRLNLSGRQGSFWQPTASAINSGFWVAYGYLKQKKDWPMIFANVVGILFSAVTAITAVVRF